MINKRKGISLIVLVITIIVIVILAEAIIIGIVNNNPIEKAKEAKFKEDIKNFQYELVLSVAAEYTDSLGERKNKINASSLQDIQKYIPSFNNEYVGKLEIKNDELVFIDGAISGKEKEWFYNIEYKTQIGYEILSITNNKASILLTVENNAGIKKVICPNGTEIEGNNKIKIDINYEVEQAEYAFIVQTSSGRSETVKLNINYSNINIKEKTTTAYPTITENGVKVEKVVSIEYNNEGKDNYYSLDNGDTWLEYKDELKFTKAGTIKAKTTINNVTQVISKNITFTLASDAISSIAYDGNRTNILSLKTNYSRKIMVDSSMYGKNIYITAAENSQASDTIGCYIYAYFSNGSNRRIYRTSSANPSYTRKPVAIPEGTQYLIFKVGNNENNWWQLKEIEVK